MVDTIFFTVLENVGCVDNHSNDINKSSNSNEDADDDANDCNNEEDDSDDDDNNDNNNDICIQRCNSRFVQSPHCATDCLQHVCSGGPGAIVCKSPATYQALITWNTSSTHHLEHIKHSSHATRQALITWNTSSTHHMQHQALITCNTSSTHHMQHIKHSSHTTCRVPHSTKGQLSY